MPKERRKSVAMSEGVLGSSASDHGRIVLRMRKRDEPVRLTKIYTRGGDAGETSLGDGSRVSKLDPRIAAYGTVDETNAAIGAVLAGDCPERIRDVLARVQNELFDLGADLSVPLERDGRLRVTQEQVDALERDCDTFNADLPELKSFVLPGRDRGGRSPPRRSHDLSPRRARGAGGVAVGIREPADAQVSEPALRPSLRPRTRRERARRPRGAALEAWELGLAFAGSFVAGYVGSMLGLVLGTLRLPLILVATGSPASAAGTNIAISAASAGAGGLRHVREGRVDWHVVAWMAPPSVVGAVVGALLADDVSETVLYAAIAAVLVWSGIDLALRPITARPRERLRLLRGSAFGLLIGAIGGAVGVILGTLRMPALVRSVGLEVRRAAGTNLVVGFMLGVAGFATHAAATGVEWSILGPASQERSRVGGSARRRPAASPRTG